LKKKIFNSTDHISFSKLLERENVLMNFFHFLYAINFFNHISFVEPERIMIYTTFSPFLKLKFELIVYTHFRKALEIAQEGSNKYDEAQVEYYIGQTAVFKGDFITGEC
jgi:hypothetical protein